MKWDLIIRQTAYQTTTIITTLAYFVEGYFLFIFRNWNILNSSEEEEEVNNLPNLDGDSPGYSPAVDYSNLVYNN